VAAKVHDTDVMVRVARGSYSDHVKPLELDAAGIMVPHVMSLADARRVVSMTRFHPIGRRPVDGGNADGSYCAVDSLTYFREANRERFVCVQIEDPEPLDDLDAIAALDGIDMLFFGPADFSQGIGAPGSGITRCLWRPSQGRRGVREAWQVRGHRGIHRIAQGASGYGLPVYRHGRRRGGHHGILPGLIAECTRTIASRHDPRALMAAAMRREPADRIPTMPQIWYDFPSGVCRGEWRRGLDRRHGALRGDALAHLRPAYPHRARHGL